MSIIAAIRARDLGKTQRFLESRQYDVNAVDLNEHMDHKHNPQLRLSLPSLVHLAASVNDPRLLSLFIGTYNAKISRIEEVTPSKFLEVLLNRVFDNDVKTFSALKNIDILYKNGASIPESVVSQLFLDFNHMPLCRENLKKIIKKLYILKAMNVFLDHVKNNRVQEVNRIRRKNINLQYPELQRLGITGYIDPNYDAGVHGLAILIAAELPNTDMLELLSEDQHPWLIVANRVLPVM